LGNTLGTGGTLLRILWEFDGNTLGTKINPTLSFLSPKGEKLSL
jgi:hypothetical protein